MGRHELLLSGRGGGLNPRSPGGAVPARAVAGVSAVPALEEVRGPVDRVLDEFLGRRIAELTALDPVLGELTGQVESLVGAGGKRLRPAFLYWGCRAAGGAADEGVLRAAAAVELLHTFALLHDDVMDRSVERRGRPSAHLALAAAHRAAALEGDDQWFGVGGAILAGDLAYVLADELFDSAELAAGVRARARQAYNLLRVEVTAGQYLDLRLAGHGMPTPAEVLQVALLKSGRYSVTRPLQIGAALADPGPSAAAAELAAGLSVYGDAVGVAFQLRDDVLGLFGDTAETGKGALDDLREGKRTLLVVLALERAGPKDRRVLKAALGHTDVDEEAAARIRTIVVTCGALQAVEELVAERRRQALDALAGLRGVPPTAREALEQLASLAAFRLG